MKEIADLKDTQQRQDLDKGNEVAGKSRPDELMGETQGTGGVKAQTNTSNKVLKDSNIAEPRIEYLSDMVKMILAQRDLKMKEEEGFKWNPKYSSKGWPKPTDAEVEAEAKWIYHSQKHWREYQSSPEMIIEGIKNVLNNIMMKIDYCSFRSTYRDHIIQRSLHWGDYFAIYRMDLKWEDFIQCKKNVQRALYKIRSYKSKIVNIDTLVENAMSIDELQMINRWINIYKGTIEDLQPKHSEPDIFQKT